MAAREVRLFGDPMLRRKAEPVAEVSDEVETLISDMFETMYREEGVGLAAPQVGVSQRIIVVDPHEDGVRPFALVNPEILEVGEAFERGEEGCLSLPGLKDVVERPTTCVVKGLQVAPGAPGASRPDSSATDRAAPDVKPEPREVRIETSGLLARVLQHEVDHLNGILFIDRVSPLKRKMLLKKWKKTRAA